MSGRRMVSSNWPKTGKSIDRVTSTVSIRAIRRAASVSDRSISRDFVESSGRLRAYADGY
jgi:hypothetical protein